jgi:hypothetical protein
MSPVTDKIIATLTVRTKDEPELLAIINNLHIDQFQRAESYSRQGAPCSSYTIDSTPECFECISNRVPVLSSTVTHYSTSDLGLKIIQ